GGVAFLFFLLLICCCCCCRHQRRKKMNAVKMKQPKATRPIIKQVMNGIKTYHQRIVFGFHPNPKPKPNLGPNSVQLEVCVLKGEGLASNDFGGSSDPYVKVMLLPNNKQKFETKVHRKSRSPQFNETMYFEVSAEELPERTLLLSLYDFKRFSKHELVGEIRVPFADLDFTNMIEECRSLQPAANEEPEFLGEICFSLRYVPNTNKLTVIVLEAKELKACNEEELSGNNNIHNGMRFGTLVREQSLRVSFMSPCTSFKQKVQLVVSVVHSGGIKQNTCIGKIMVGNNATGGCLQHWNDMKSNPRRPVAQWHPLQHPDEVKANLKN
uniref:C2 domain-containing protein n=1 Tax=Eptatretus burgeri TaxID=7764 RepID=A0A8C4N357_EPTBU